MDKQTSSGNAPQLNKVPFGPVGQWAVFKATLTEEDKYDVETLMRRLIGFILGTEEGPHMLTAYYDSGEDDTPKYRIIAFDVPYGAYLHLMETAQPSWFTVKVEERPAGFNIRLTPSRSLMKLLYKEVYE